MRHHRGDPTGGRFGSQTLRCLCDAWWTAGHFLISTGDPQEVPCVIREELPYLDLMEATLTRDDGICRNRCWPPQGGGTGAQHQGTKTLLALHYRTNRQRPICARSGRERLPPPCALTFSLTTATSDGQQPGSRRYIPHRPFLPATVPRGPLASPRVFHPTDSAASFRWIRIYPATERRRAGTRPDVGMDAPHGGARPFEEVGQRRPLCAPTTEQDGAFFIGGRHFDGTAGRLYPRAWKCVKLDTG